MKVTELFKMKLGKEIILNIDGLYMFTNRNKNVQFNMKLGNQFNSRKEINEQTTAL